MSSNFRAGAPRLVVFGEFFFDLVFYGLASCPRFGSETRTKHFVEAPGGGVSTTAMVAAALGTTTAVVTRVGVDARSDPAWRRFSALGIETDACEFRKDFPTAITVSVAYGRDRMMITHDPINETLGELLSKPKVLRLLRAARHAHFAFAFQNPARWLPVLDDLRGRGITLSADLGWNPEVFHSPALPHLLRRLDLFFPNEAEAGAITGEPSALGALRQLGRWVRWPVLKLGAKGCAAVLGSGVLRVPAFPARVVDATGAGDAFNGGFLHAYLRGRPWLECLRAGNICGSLATTAAGGAGVLPKPSQLERATTPGGSRKACRP